MNHKLAVPKFERLHNQLHQCTSASAGAILLTSAAACPQDRHHDTSPDPGTQATCRPKCSPQILIPTHICQFMCLQSWPAVTLHQAYDVFTDHVIAEGSECLHQWPPCRLQFGSYIDKTTTAQELFRTRFVSCRAACLRCSPSVALLKKR